MELEKTPDVRLSCVPPSEPQPRVVERTGISVEFLVAVILVRLPLRLPLRLALRLRVLCLPALVFCTAQLVF